MEVAHIKQKIKPKQRTQSKDPSLQTPGLYEISALYYVSGCFFRSSKEFWLFIQYLDLSSGSR